MWYLYVVAAVLLSLLLIDWSLTDKQFDEIPGPPGIILFHNALDFIQNPVQTFLKFRHFATEYKRIYKLKMGPKKIVVLLHPEDAEVILSSTKNIEKGYFYSFLRPWLQDGLLLSTGSKWQHRRKIITPTFHFNILKQFNKLIQENCVKLVNNLKHEVGKPKMQPAVYITDLTLNSICETAMGAKLDENIGTFSKKYKNSIHRLGEIVFIRGQRFWLYTDFIFNLSSVGREFKNITNQLGIFRDGIINKRRILIRNKNVNFDESSNGVNDEDMGKKRMAMLDMLLQAEDKGAIDAKGISEEVDTFMFEGHDTTATALLFTILLLANHPDSQVKILEEYNTILGASTRDPNLSDLSQMKYLECCIKEAMRLYPPVFFILRKLVEPLRLKDYTIPVGTECCVFIYDLHRRSDQFEEPEEFRPERFLKDPTWHLYSYIPFSAGPRNCIGQKFAMMEMKLTVLSILRRYILLPITKPQDVVFRVDFILRPNNPIYVKLEERVQLP